MINMAHSAYNALLDLSADVLLGALLLAAILAMTVAGLFALLRQRTADAPGLVGGMVLVACTLSMTLALGYSHERHQAGPNDPPLPPSFPINHGGPRSGPPGYGQGPGFGPLHPMYMGSFLSQLVMDAYDLDHNGLLTQEEAAGALAEILKDADGRERSSLERGDLELHINRGLQARASQRCGRSTSSLPAAAPPVHSSSKSSSRSG